MADKYVSRYPQTPNARSEIRPRIKAAAKVTSPRPPISSGVGSRIGTVSSPTNGVDFEMKASAATPRRPPARAKPPVHSRTGATQPASLDPIPRVPILSSSCRRAGTRRFGTSQAASPSTTPREKDAAATSSRAFIWTVPRCTSMLGQSRSAFATALLHGLPSSKHNHAPAGSSGRKARASRLISAVVSYADHASNLESPA